MSTTLSDLPLRLNDGRETRLADYRGKVLLVVNVASKCGLTSQYRGLEQLYRAQHARGFEVLAFPANDFAGQEPGDDTEIRSFCDTNYEISFPLFSKVTVVGAGKHPLFGELTAAQPQAQDDAGFRAKLAGYGMTPNPAPELLWNFEKFLVARDGTVVARFSPDIPADDPRIVDAVERELAKAV